MKPIVLFLIVLFIPQHASAGVGLTAHITETRSSTQQYSSSMEELPTLDYVSDTLLIQLNVLETLASLPQENLLRIGLNGYYTLRQAAVSESLMGTLQLGFSLDVIQNNTISDNEHTEIWGLLQPRLGIQMSDSAGVGIYVVPSIGWAHIPVQNGNDITLKHDLAIGGGLQFSVWID